jgi:hypothetical protein
MNQLFKPVIEFARYRRATSLARGPTALDPGGHRPEAGRLACSWRRDRVSGKLICVWASTVAARDWEPPSRRFLAA